jgi:site-specific recombinase XerC
MTLAELHERLAPSFPPSVRKDLQTAIRVLAQALHCPDAHHCPLERCIQPLPTLYRHVEDYLIGQGKSPHTVRNTKNNLSRLFRLAEHQQLFSLTPAVLTPRYDSENKAYRPGGSHTKRNGTYLPYVQWPPDLKADFGAFEAWATLPLISGRAARLRKRLTTVDVYKKQFELYFGYLHYKQSLVPTFEHLFDIDRITDFVHWHVNDCHHGPTRTLYGLLVNLCALTRQYRPMPELRAQLTALLKTMPVPPPIYNKADAWVSLAALQEIARSIWPRKKPIDLRRQPNRKPPGTRFAARAGVSLMLWLWSYIPYRQRNMREMLLGDNLHKDAHGTWHLTFKGEQLKVAIRRGQLNVLDLTLPEKLVPLLEEYLATWRPLLLTRASQSEQHVFLTGWGNPYTSTTLRNTVGAIVYRYTGQHWHPHIVRTVWATEWMSNGGDMLKAARMLNDKLETVVANYSHLHDLNFEEEVYAVLDRRNGHGK